MLRKRDRNDLPWCLPGGCTIGGESALAALRRNVLEETGLRATPGLLLVEHHMPATTKVAEGSNPIFDCGKLSPEAVVRLKESEFSEYAFIARNQLADAAQPHQCTHHERKGTDASVYPASPNTVLANAFTHAEDVLAPRINAMSPADVTLVAGTQVSGVPHLSTSLVQSLSFAAAARVRLDVPVNVHFGAFDNAPHEAVSDAASGPVMVKGGYWVFVHSLSTTSYRRPCRA